MKKWLLSPSLGVSAMEEESPALRLSDSNREILYAYAVCPGCRRGRSPFRP